jgi:hypothetical protein
MSSAAQAWVDVNADEIKPPQPLFLVDWDQGPELVPDRRDYPDYTFNPQRIQPSGDVDHDAYPANPVIAWHNWTYRDPSQSIKVPNVGATNITPRALLQQQLGRQLSPITYPNQVTQSPVDWDDQVQVLPTESHNSVEQQRIALAQQFAGYSPAVVQ